MDGIFRTRLRATHHALNREANLRDRLSGIERTIAFEPVGDTLERQSAAEFATLNELLLRPPSSPTEHSALQQQIGTVFALHTLSTGQILPSVLHELGRRCGGFAPRRAEFYALAGLAHPADGAQRHLGARLLLERERGFTGIAERLHFAETARRQNAVSIHHPNFSEMERQFFGQVRRLATRLPIVGRDAAYLDLLRSISAIRDDDTRTIAAFYLAARAESVAAPLRYLTAATTIGNVSETFDCDISLNETLAFVAQNRGRFQQYHQTWRLLLPYFSDEEMRASFICGLSAALPQDDAEASHLELTRAAGSLLMMRPRLRALVELHRTAQGENAATRVAHIRALLAGTTDGAAIDQVFSHAGMRRPQSGNILSEIASAIEDPYAQMIALTAIARTAAPSNPPEFLFAIADRIIALTDPVSVVHGLCHFVAAGQCFPELQKPILALAIRHIQSVPLREFDPRLPLPIYQTQFQRALTPQLHRDLRELSAALSRPRTQAMALIQLAHILPQESTAAAAFSLERRIRQIDDPGARTWAQLQLIVHSPLSFPPAAQAAATRHMIRNCLPTILAHEIDPSVRLAQLDNGTVASFTRLHDLGARFPDRARRDIVMAALSTPFARDPAISMA